MSKGFVTFKNMAHRAFQRGAPKNKSVEGEKQPVNIRTTPVIWGVPCDEVMYSRFYIRFEGTANKMPWDGFASEENTYLENARNLIHNKFIKSSTYPYLMMLDSDILFPPDMLDRLLSHNVGIVGGWYRDKKAEDHHPCVYDYIKDEEGISFFKHRNEPGTGLEKVDGMGAGCWLMSREVAEALGENPYGKNVAGGGEDFKLCKRLLELGIPLYVDWSINCAHLGVGFW